MYIDNFWFKTPNRLHLLCLTMKFKIKKNRALCLLYFVFKNLKLVKPKNDFTVKHSSKNLLPTVIVLRKT